jgi:hypothetical protein
MSHADRFVIRNLRSSPSSPTLPARAGQVLPVGEGSSYLFVIPKESMAIISLSFRVSRDEGGANEESERPNTWYDQT